MMSRQPKASPPRRRTVLMIAALALLGSAACNEGLHPPAHLARDAGVDERGDTPAADTETDSSVQDTGLADAGPDGQTDADDAAEADVVDARDDAPDLDAGDTDTGQAARDCTTVTFSYDAGTEIVVTAIVAGSFNDWGAEVASGGWPLSDADGDNVWTMTTQLDPGVYQYKFVINGEWRTDPINPMTVDDGFGGENSLLEIVCGQGFEVDSYASDESTGTIAAVVRLVGEGSLASGTARVTLDHEPVPPDTVTVSGRRLSVTITDVAPGIHDLRLSATLSGGRVAGPILLKFYLGESTDWADDVIYFAMTDRFRNGDGTNDAPVAEVESAVNWRGGDFAGLSQTLESGYFDALGVGALWISWPIENFSGYHEGTRPAEHACGLAPGSFATAPTRYTAYHGYWPSDTTAIDPHFGTLAELQGLVVTAHAHGIRVVLDFTANHVDTSSPLFQEHAEDYFNWPDNGFEHVCSEVGWDTEPETCWFTPYLADFDYRRAGAIDAVVDQAIEWIIATGADGFRVDAVKHVHRDFLRSLRSRLAHEVELTNIPFYLVGETFTGDAGLIASYVGDDLIHGQFDFPLNLKVLEAFATRTIGLDELDQAARSIKATYGDGLMSNFIGNHDIARFVSMAAGDIFCGPWDIVSNIAQGWLYPPSAPSNPDAYAYLRLAFTYVMTVPGVPLIYYGDELGMPGAGDPDNRRMMRFGAALSGAESSTLAFMQRLGTARAAHPALRTGSWEAPLVSEDDVLAYARAGAGETALIVLNRSSTTRTVDLGVTGLGVSDGTVFVDTLAESTSTATVSTGQLSISVPPLSAMVWVSE